MKIVIVSHAGGSPYHGPNMRSYYLARKLVGRGHTVQIISSSFFHKYFNPPKVQGAISDEIIDGIEYRWLKTVEYPKRNYKQIINQFDFAFKLWKYRKKLFRDKPDVVIFSSPPPVAILPIIAAKKINKFTLIFEARDIWPMGILGLGLINVFHPYALLLSYIEKMAYKRADAIVSVKKGDYVYFNNKFKQHFFKYNYIPNGYDIESSDKQIQNNGKNKKFTFGYIGAMSNVYNIDLLLKAAVLLQRKGVDILVQLVGSGNDLNRLKNKTSSLNLQNVEFVGSVPKNKVMSYLSNFDVAIISLNSTPAYKFGVSANKMYEYMYAKKPILAIYDTDFDDVVDSGCGISLRNPNPEVVANTMEKMLKLPQDYRVSLGKKGYDYYLKNYTFDLIADKYEELFSRII